MDTTIRLLERTDYDAFLILINEFRPTHFSFSIYLTIFPCSCFPFVCSIPPPPPPRHSPIIIIIIIKYEYAGRAELCLGSPR